MLDYTRLYYLKNAKRSHYRNKNISTLTFYITNLLHSYFDALHYENLKLHITRAVEDYLIRAQVADFKTMRLKV